MNALALRPITHAVRHLTRGPQVVAYGPPLPECDDDENDASDDDDDPAEEVSWSQRELSRGRPSYYVIISRAVAEALALLHRRRPTLDILWSDDQGLLHTFGGVSDALKELMAAASER